MSVSVDSLEKIVESDCLPIDSREIVSILLAAINDWPSAVASLTGYEAEVHSSLRREINGMAIEEYISKVDYSKSAWEAESLSTLLKVYNYYDRSRSLAEVLSDIEEKVRPFVV